MQAKQSQSLNPKATLSFCIYDVILVSVLNSSGTDAKEVKIWSWTDQKRISPPTAFTFDVF